MFQRLAMTGGGVVVLREGHPDDAPAFFTHRQQVLHETDLLLQAPDDFEISVASERELLARCRASAQHLVGVAVVESSRSACPMVAHITLFPGAYRRNRHTVQLGLAVSRQWWGQGVGLGLLQLAVSWADANPAVHKVSLQTYASNERARALFQRAGFTEEGRLRAEVRRDDGTLDDLVAMGRLCRMP